ncbi:MAG: hypothetical protein JWN87_1917 [Frankiales bacterium]|nr:hypothetical protein [Frankiales bacterium]MCW2584644.1 hypothetical protein [Frankiales bacterium]
MPFTVVLATEQLVVDADEHRLEGRFHVFRSSTSVMGRPRTMVVRRLPATDVLSVTAVP